MQYGDAVGIAPGGDAVRDENGRTAAHDVAQMIENLGFGVGVDAGERVVEDENLRTADESAGNCGALLLSAGKRNAAFSDHGVVAFGEGFDVGRDVRRISRVTNILVGGRVHAERDVLADAIAE